jgi:hypothetical protein
LPSPEQVKVKGIGFEGVVAALRPSFEKSNELVPEPLRHYLHETIDPGGWYALPDYFALMKILASTIDPAKAKGDVYRAFGVIAAQRDVFGVQPNVPREQQPATVASFQGALRGVTGLASLVKRALHLRERYYSHGYYTVKRVAERKLEVTLLEFPVCAELCAVSTGYLTHMMRSANVGAWVERISCCGTGDASCRWEIRFADATDVSDLAIFGGDGSAPRAEANEAPEPVSARPKKRDAADSMPSRKPLTGTPPRKDAEAAERASSPGKPHAADGQAMRPSLTGARASTSERAPQDREDPSERMPLRPPAADDGAPARPSLTGERSAPHKPLLSGRSLPARTSLLGTSGPPRKIRKNG